MFDGTFTFVQSFSDPGIPKGFAPYGIQTVNDQIWVTFTALDKAQGGWAWRISDARLNCPLRSRRTNRCGPSNALRRRSRSATRDESPDRRAQLVIENLGDDSLIRYVEHFDASGESVLKLPVRCRLKVSSRSNSAISTVRASALGPRPSAALGRKSCSAGGPAKAAASARCSRESIAINISSI